MFATVAMVTQVGFLDHHRGGAAHALGRIQPARRPSGTPIRSLREAAAALEAASSVASGIRAQQPPASLEPLAVVQKQREASLDRSSVARSVYSSPRTRSSSASWSLLKLANAAAVRAPSQLHVPARTRSLQLL